ncbi:P-type conjugative transfer protein TrbL, partial [Herbaspirillum sp. HC18]
AAAATRGGAAIAGGASTAYSLGAAGQSGAAGVASGLGGVARVGGSAAVSPLRRAASRAADSMRSSFNAGGKAAFEATGGKSTMGSIGGDAAGDGAAQAAAGGPPAWAQRMRRSQHMTHAVQATAHAVRSGDAHGGGSS